MSEHVPHAITIVAPSVVGVDEPFALGVKLTTEPYAARAAASWKRPTVSVAGPFNRSARGIEYLDNVPPTWEGCLQVVPQDALHGLDEVEFNEHTNGTFSSDRRPIRRVEGFRFSQAGTGWIQLHDPETGLTGTSNPIRVTAQPPVERLFWGDLHVHTIFTDALRVPEELYAFARDEAFLDVCALTDHSEGISDAQWCYFVDVTNRSNLPGRFATLVAGEWTSMTYGHHNYYYRGDDGPIFRCTDETCETLGQFHDAARDAGALVVPHHSANTTMGVDWAHGHAPDIERLVEVHSAWGSSEQPAEAGNPFPIRACGGEQAGQHVTDALARGYRLGFVGSGDTHDGRPGEAMHFLQAQPREYRLLYPQGIVGIWARDLTREAVFDALWNRRVFATMNHRTLLRFFINDQPMGAQIVHDGEPLRIAVDAASDQPIRKVELVAQGETRQTLTPDEPLVDWRFTETPPGTPTWYYIRLTRADGTLAWSSPIWIDPQ